MKHSQGFTLIEVVIALAISAFIAIATVQVTRSTLNKRDQLDEQNTFITQLSRAYRIIEQDFIQVQPDRAVKDAFGDYSESLVLSFDGLFLTRNGWAQSQFIPYERSTLQRVHYRIAQQGSELCDVQENDYFEDNGGCLIRSYTAHLDDDGTLVWQHQKLIRSIVNIEWRFLTFDSYDNKTQFSNTTPTVDPRTNLFTQQVIGVELEFEFTSGEKHKRIFKLPTSPIESENEEGSLT